MRGFSNVASMCVMQAPIKTLRARILYETPLELDWFKFPLCSGCVQK